MYGQGYSTFLTVHFDKYSNSVVLPTATLLCLDLDLSKTEIVPINLFPCHNYKGYFLRLPNCGRKKRGDAHNSKIFM